MIEEGAKYLDGLNDNLYSKSPSLQHRFCNRDVRTSLSQRVPLVSTLSALPEAIRDVFGEILINSLVDCTKIAVIMIPSKRPHQ